MLDIERDIESVEPDTQPTTARNSVVEEVVSRDDLLGRVRGPAQGGSLAHTRDPRRYGAGGIPRAITVPLLPAGTPQQTQSTWHSSTSLWKSGAAISRSSNSSWRPLGSTWRDWDAQLANSSSRSTVGGPHHTSASESAKPYIHGCIPHWGKDATIKMKASLEHDLTWLFYRIRRQRDHPMRNRVIHPKVNGVQLDFWEVCKPPFAVTSCARASESGNSEGILHQVKYECGVDYATERLGEDSSEGGTFDNKLCGVAEVRVLPNFPKERPITVVSWGAPSMFSGPEMCDSGKGVDPDIWNPLADLLGCRPDDPRLRSVNEAARRAAATRSKGSLSVPPMQKALLGPHPALPQLARCASEAGQPGSRGAAASGEAGGTVKKMRKHKIFTAACGFVEFHG